MNAILSLILFIKALAPKRINRNLNPLYKHFFVDYPYDDGDG